MPKEPYFDPGQCEQYFDPGQWGYYRNILNGEVMNGFHPDPPPIDEICGEYEIVFVASLTYCNLEQNALWHLRRRASGSLLIVKPSPDIQSFVPGDFFGKVITAPGTSYSVEKYFGGGYNIYGTGKDPKTYGGHCCSNCFLIKTLRNNNIGRLYVVSERKAFPRIKNENGWMGYGNANGIIYESQEHETMEAERICNSRHYSFLCRDLGFSCAVASLITRFAMEDVPFFFAEPGDIWIDIKLSTPTRTYVLARRRHNFNWQTKFIERRSLSKQLSYLTASPADSKYRLPLDYWTFTRNLCVPPCARNSSSSTTRGRNRSRQVGRRRRNNAASRNTQERDN
jgi:hypothetical protein